MESTNNSEFKLSEMQNKLLSMMEFFHDYCKNNGLRYFAVGGTALGAVRHQGFIPWDDDIDVGMPRSDYEKLLDLFGDSIINHITIESVRSTDKSFWYPFAKLYDTTTTLIENTRNHIRRGIYIDIFPLDGIGDSEQEAKNCFASIDKKKKLLGLRTMKINSTRAVYKNITLRIIQAIPNFIFDEKKLCIQIDELCKRKNFDSCALVGNLTGAWGWKEIMPIEFFGAPRLHKFESIEVHIPEACDDYLTHIYGDWQKLPPKEKQISHHNYYLDLHTSYL